jgi:hypothetical protein
VSDPAGHYADPLEEALSHGAQRVAQLASLVGAAAEVTMRRNALRNARESEQVSRVIRDQERAEAEQARLRWGPAHDPRWLAQADLLQTARAWSGAASYADTDPVAASAMRKSEERLRRLHPYAMARYDRLRSEGAGPLDAMRTAAPLFARAPHARPGDAGAPRRPIGAPSEQEDSQQLGEHPVVAPRAEPGADERARAELRGREIAERLRDRARAAGAGELHQHELEVVLEIVTNLPSDMVRRIAADYPPAVRGSRHSPGAGQTAVRLAAGSFPVTAAEAVGAARPGPAAHPAGRAARPRRTQRPGR